MGLKSSPKCACCMLSLLTYIQSCPGRLSYNELELRPSIKQSPLPLVNVNGNSGEYSEKLQFVSTLLWGKVEGAGSVAQAKSFVL